MNTFAIGSLPVHFSVAKLFNFRWQYTNGNDWYLKNSTEQTIGISYVQTWNLESSKHETQNYLVCNSLIFALFLSNYFRNSIRIFFIYLRYYTKFV